MFYDMTGSDNGQDEANSQSWLATRVSKAGPACLDKISRFYRETNKQTNKQRTSGSLLFETPMLSVEELWVLQVPWPRFLLPPSHSEITTVKQKTHNINSFSILVLRLTSIKTAGFTLSIMDPGTPHFRVLTTQRSATDDRLFALSFVRTPSRALSSIPDLWTVKNRKGAHLSLLSRILHLNFTGRSHFFWFKCSENVPSTALFNLHFLIKPWDLNFWKNPYLINWQKLVYLSLSPSFPLLNNCRVILSTFHGS